MIIAFDARKQRETLELKQSELGTAKKDLEKTLLEGEQAVDDLTIGLAEVKLNAAKAHMKVDVPEDLVQRTELVKQHLDDELAQQELALNQQLLDTQRADGDAQRAAKRNRIAKLERELADAKDALAKMTILAPRAGYLSFPGDWNHRKPKVGESVWAGRSVVQIADLSRMEVQAQIAEPDSGKVRVGDAAEVRLNASPDRVFTGRVKTLARIFRTKSWDKPSVVRDAEILLDQPDAALMRPGMACEVVLLSSSAEPVISIPESFLRRSDAGPQVQRRKHDGGNAEIVPVTLGWRSDGAVEVRTGLADGDIVLPAGKAP
jgi:RND family efflux transporter MFP subunit